MLSNYFCELLLVLTQKEIKARYKSAILGFLWIFINPLVEMLVMGFVFSLLLHLEIKNYYLFLFIGLLPWNFFSQAINKATPRIVWDRNLIQKSKFPKETIPLSIILSHFFHFMASWFILIIFLIITRQSSILKLEDLGYQLAAIFLLLVFASGISLFTSSLTVFYRDIAFIAQTGLTLWFYTTPIIYPLSAIPEKFRPIFYLNPLLTIFNFLQKPFLPLKIPNHIIIIHIVIILFLLPISLRFFRSKAKYFSDWL